MVITKKQIDKFIIIKNPYLFLRHLVPLCIASLMLLTLSVPKDNLLLKLSKLLRSPSWIWVPAVIVTALSTTVYFLTLETQVRQLYLLSHGFRRRTIMTFFIYVILSTLMVYAVLKSVSPCSLTIGDIWACFMLAILSLTGIGWSGPKSWYKSIAIRTPNYNDAHISVEELIAIFRVIRKKEVSTKHDIEAFVEKAKNLRSHIEKNLKLEPRWVKKELSEIKTVLSNLIVDIKDTFLSAQSFDMENFAAVCKFRKEEQYETTVELLNKLGKYWPEFIEQN